jgi:hypothetical protein
MQQSNPKGKYRGHRQQAKKRPGAKKKLQKEGLLSGLKNSL